MILRTVAALALLGGCASPEQPWFEDGDPVTPEDLGALPAQVTAENALRVVRQCLQRHAASTPEIARVRYTYTLRSVPKIHLYPGFLRIERVGDLESTSGVEYRAIGEIRVDPPKLPGSSWHVHLRGAFQMGAGGAVFGMILESVTLPCRDEETATKLAAALRLAPRN